ncbi:MAG TPA: hypothetical protein VJ160_09330 [Anaerolineales bacterium]|nr:hypothetical protein [Anaerolineales bacterium]
MAYPTNVQHIGIPHATLSGLGRQLSRATIKRGMLFGLIMLAALAAFETFNYGTTEFALADLLGGLRFAGIRWATILALAFCAMDFAGLARLLTPGRPSQAIEAWYLLAAWFVAAAMNAVLTWWAVSVALTGQAGSGNGVLERATLLRIVPVFVAILVWLIRVLMIGSFTLGGSRIFSQGEGTQALYLRPIGPRRAPSNTTPPVSRQTPIRQDAAR